MAKKKKKPDEIFLMWKYAKNMQRQYPIRSLVLTSIFLFFLFQFKYIFFLQSFTRSYYLFLCTKRRIRKKYAHIHGERGK